jgi:hypothetical protein
MARIHLCPNANLDMKLILPSWWSSIWMTKAVNETTYQHTKISVNCIISSCRHHHSTISSNVNCMQTCISSFLCHYEVSTSWTSKKSRLKAWDTVTMTWWIVRQLSTLSAPNYFNFLLSLAITFQITLNLYHSSLLQTIHQVWIREWSINVSGLKSLYRTWNNNLNTHALFETELN